MSSRKLQDLTSATLPKAQRVLDLGRERGLDLLICCTLRSLEEQVRP